MFDTDNLTDEQLEAITDTLSTFAAWIELRRERPDVAPFALYADAVRASTSRREDAVDFLSVAQAVLEASRKPRLYVAGDDE